MENEKVLELINKIGNDWTLMTPKQFTNKIFRILSLAKENRICKFFRKELKRWITFREQTITDFVGYMIDSLEKNDFVYPYIKKELILLGNCNGYDYVEEIIYNEIQKKPLITEIISRHEFKIKKI